MTKKAPTLFLEKDQTQLCPAMPQATDNEDTQSTMQLQYQKPWVPLDLGQGMEKKD